MKSNRLLVMFLLVGLVAIVVGCQQQPPAPPDTRAADEAAIRAASGAWMRAAGEKDVEKVVSVYAQAVYVGRAVIGPEAFREAWTDRFPDPNYAVTWQTTKVKVARSGDLAYQMATWEETRSDAKKKPQTTKGNFFTVWEKQANGTWKIAVYIATAAQ